MPGIQVGLCTFGKGIIYMKVKPAPMKVCFQMEMFSNLGFPIDLDRLNAHCTFLGSTCLGTN